MACNKPSPAFKGLFSLTLRQVSVYSPYSGLNYDEVSGFLLTNLLAYWRAENIDLNMKSMLILRSAFGEIQLVQWASLWHQWNGIAQILPDKQIFHSHNWIPLIQVNSWFILNSVKLNYSLNVISPFPFTVINFYNPTFAMIMIFSREVLTNKKKKCDYIAEIVFNVDTFHSTCPGFSLSLLPIQVHAYSYRSLSTMSFPTPAWNSWNRLTYWWM